ncbi:MAG TPA: glycosyltransferase 87 family protein [Candidatus Limnocylindrales bacterium]|nr:glycosyltransferase 87 family protein [Candidatus Limnocylindrales bacterium]
MSEAAAHTDRAGRHVPGASRLADVAPLAAIALVAAWHVPVAYRDVFRLPFLVAAITLAAELGLGAWAAGTPALRRAVGDRRFDRRAAGILAASAGAAVALALGVVLAFDASKAAIVLGPAAYVGGALVRWRLPVRPAMVALVGLVVTLWLIVDVQLVTESSRLYDFGVYLAAGRHANAGEPVYLDHVLTSLPSSAAQDPFLYPPPLVVPLRALAALPIDAVGLAWQLGLIAAGAAGLRMLGLGWPWVALLMLWPANVQGVQSGNLANLAFLAFAAGYRHGWTLPLGVFLKVQTAIPALWLVRERHWRALGIGIAVAAAVVLATLPFVGLGAWSDWLAGLVYRQQSQEALPFLYGMSLAAYLPAAGFAVLAVLATGLALVPSGRRGLAALGLASIVASPTLWPHGFMVALPAGLATTSAALLWLALGLGTRPLGLWFLFALGVVAVIRDWVNLRIPADATHPLSGSIGPWTAPGVAPRGDV